MAEFLFDWPDIVAFLVLIFCFFLAIVSKNLVFTFIIVFLVGLVFGRIWYRFKGSSKIALVIIMLGALLGFLLALVIKKPELVVILFLLGVAIGFWVHEKGYIKSIEY